MSNIMPEGNPVDELAEEFARRLRAGEHPSIEEYANRHPLLAAEIRDILSAVVVIEQHKTGRVDAFTPAPKNTLRPERSLERPPERVGEYRIRTGGRGESHG